MKTNSFFFALFFLAQLSFGQSIQTDWCSVFHRIEKTGYLAKRESDSINPVICNSKYYVIIAKSDTIFKEQNCTSSKLQFVDAGEMLFCNNTGFNIINNVTVKKRKIFVWIDVVSNNSLKYRMLFIVKNNVNRKVKTKILKS